MNSCPFPSRLWCQAGVSDVKIGFFCQPFPSCELQHCLCRTQKGTAVQAKFHSSLPQGFSLLPLRTSWPNFLEPQKNLTGLWKLESCISSAGFKQLVEPCLAACGLQCGRLPGWHMQGCGWLCHVGSRQEE